MSKPKKDNKDLKNFTSNEVAALVEGLKSDFRGVAEGVTSLQENMTDVKDRLSNIESKVSQLKDAVSIAIPDLNKRVTKLEIKVGI